MRVVTFSPAALAGLLAAALTCSSIHPVYAQGQPGDFDFYLLSLSVAPSFCDQMGYKEGKKECAAGSDEAYQATPLTVHGLWPNKEGVSGKNQPGFCTDEQPERLPDDLFAQLKTYMPGVADGLEKSEWQKHGTCSGLSYEQYYRDVVALASYANTAIGSALRDNSLLGTTVQLKDLISAVAAKDPVLASAISVDCQFAHPHGGGEARAYIVELRIFVDKDLSGLETGQGVRFLPLESEGGRLNSGCQNGAGFLPGSFEE